MLELFLLAFLSGYLGTVAGNLTSEYIHDQTHPEKTQAAGRGK